MFKRKEKEDTTAKCIGCHHTLEKEDMKEVEVEYRQVAGCSSHSMSLSPYVRGARTAYVCNLHKQNYDKIDRYGDTYRKVPEKWVKIKK